MNTEKTQLLNVVDTASNQPTYRSRLRTRKCLLSSNITRLGWILRSWINL